MVIVFSGKPGSGKTLSAVRYIVKDKRKTVFTNVKVEIPGKRIIRILPSSLEDLKKLRDGIVFIDEANMVFSSRFWSRIPKDIIQFWAMHRKRGVDLVLTSHSLKRIDIILRELVSYEVRCKNLFNSLVVVNNWYDVDYGDRVKTSVFFGPRYYKYYDTFELVSDTAWL
jgi:zona occludens toxin (predicted ATPase)